MRPFTKDNVLTAVLVSSLSCACGALGAMSTGITTNVPSSRLTDAEYRSPNGEYTVRVPRLIKPGMRVEERQENKAHVIAFGDDFGRLYAIEMTGRARLLQTVEEVAASVQLDEVVREKEILTTGRGPELRGVLVMPGGSPLVAMTIEKGVKTEQSLDLVQARSFFVTEKHEFTVSASRTRLEESMTDDVLVQGVKGDLETFLSGLVVHER